MPSLWWGPRQTSHKFHARCSDPPLTGKLLVHSLPRPSLDCGKVVGFSWILHAVQPGLSLACSVRSGLTQWKLFLWLHTTEIHLAITLSRQHGVNRIRGGGGGREGPKSEGRARSLRQIALKVGGEASAGTFRVLMPKMLLQQSRIGF